MTKKQKKLLIRIISSAVLFAFGLLIREEKYRALVLILSFAAVGYSVIIKAAKNIFHGQVFDENFLMTVACAGALALGEYAEAAAVMLFYQIGELFESIAVGRSRDSVSALIDLAPEYANVIRNGEICRVLPEEVETGEVLVIKPGEKVPVDAKVTEGETLLDTSALTGESVPLEVSAGDEILSGSINISAAIKVRAEKEFENSTVSRIMYLIEEATDNKSEAESFITRFAKYYTPAVVAFAVLLAVSGSLVTGEVSKWVSRALLFLVVSCPCALVISVPLSFFCGIGRASKSGILVKGSNFLEAVSKAQSFAFDKTGTLTSGKFRVEEICPDGMTKDELLEICALAESYIDHPIARCIREAYGEKTGTDKIENAKQLTGFGVSCRVCGRDVLVGNEKLMEKSGVAFEKAKTPLTVIYAALDGKYAGYITVADEMKSGADEAIRELRTLGVRNTVMLTGDSAEAGRYVSQKAGIDTVEARLLPQDKVRIIEKIKQKSLTVYTGDGLNDAPVIAAADVGIAMGKSGSAAAIEEADIVIMNDDIKKIPEAVRIGRKTMRIVRENVIFALSVKLAVMVLGTLGIANMWLAVFADVGVSVIAVLNALRGQR